jgi:hypothetical protein
MTQLTSTELTLILSAAAFGVLFFIAVSIGILSVFKRLENEEKEMSAAQQAQRESNTD